MDMYARLKELVNGRPCKQFPLTGENEDGELVNVFEGHNGGVHYYGTDISQNNGWNRIALWYEDGTAEEWYER